MYKFYKKIIANNDFDDYYEKFGYKNFGINAAKAKN